MTDQQDPRKERYDRARSAFDELKIEEKTLFLIKETVNTIVEGVEEATRSIFNEFETLFGDVPVADPEVEQAEKAVRAAAQEAASSTTASRPKRSTRSKTRSTAAKTSAAKKTNPKQTTPRPDDTDAS